VASSRTRQRKMARAKFDRQLARRADAARRKRQVQAGVGAGLAVLLIVVGSVWLLGGFDGKSKPAAAPNVCEWNPQNAQTNSSLKEVGTPPTKGVPTSGTATMTMTTNQGTVDVALDLAKAPCAGASFTFLSGQGFFNNTSCHQLLTSAGMYALRCGDPTGTGQGGPTYTFFDENLPAAADASPSADPSASASASASPTPSASPTAPTYPKGTVAMAADTAGANGSQFYIFYQDSTPQTPQYSIIGTVTTGLDVIEKIAKAGAVDNDSGEKTKPKTTVTIQNLTMVGPATPSATATGTATTAPAATSTATATPSATSNS